MSFYKSTKIGIAVGVLIAAYIIFAFEFCVGCNNLEWANYVIFSPLFLWPLLLLSKILGSISGGTLLVLLLLIPFSLTLLYSAIIGWIIDKIKAKPNPSS